MRGQKDRFFYPAVLRWIGTDEQIKTPFLWVRFPDFDRLSARGESEEEALRNARRVLGEELVALEKRQIPFPAPSSLMELAVKAEERTMLVDVFLPSVRLELENRAITRTVSVPAWLNAAALERNISFSQALQGALKDMLEDDWNTQ